MGVSKVEEKKQACRDILERGMTELANPTEHSWFDRARFLLDIERALEELDDAASAEQESDSGSGNA